MSTASFFYDDTPPADSYERWQRIVRSNPRVLEYQNRLFRRPASHSYDMPYLAGYNTQGTQIYIDRHLPFIMDLGKQRICVRDFIMLHESSEKSLLALLKFQYEEAHHIATGVEYHGVEDVGFKVPDYKKLLRPFIKADSAEKLLRIPADLDLTPMKGDALLLAKLKPLMAKEKKTSKHLFAPRT